MNICVYCHKPIYPPEGYQLRRIYIPELHVSQNFWMHDSCYQARLRWQQEDQL